jgi:thiol-disulfide isomerase/thioredoxin
MALTPSTMLALGTEAPDFRLPDPDGRMVARDDFADAPALLVAFWCNHCPYVQHIRAGFAGFAREYRARGLAIAAINANDAKAHPDDAPPRMAEEIRRQGYVFPYLYDESQAVAQAYRAACTPDFFLFDRGRKLAYRGQFDDSRPGNGRPVTGADLRAAADAVLGGRAAASDQPRPFRYSSSPFVPGGRWRRARRCVASRGAGSCRAECRAGHSGSTLGAPATFGGAIGRR